MKKKSTLREYDRLDPVQDIVVCPQCKIGNIFEAKKRKSGYLVLVCKNCGIPHTMAGLGR
jgi:transcription elongation factor Elf1